MAERFDKRRHTKFDTFIYRDDIMLDEDRKTFNLRKKSRNKELYSERKMINSDKSYCNIKTVY